MATHRGADERAWSGVVLGLRDAGRDRMASRLPTHLHPLAGRALAWHVLHAVARLEPPPRRLELIGIGSIDPGLVGALPARTTAAATATDCWHLLAERAASAEEPILLVDATAAALNRSLDRMTCGLTGRALCSADGVALALWIDAADLRERIDAADVADDSDRAVADLSWIAEGLETVQADPLEGFLVRDRKGFARANRVVRDRIVQQHMAAGVTFLLPDTVLVDVDVAIEQDTIVYPGVVLEGNTSIGGETVVGPGCRIIDSNIGRGVELKGWNYISHTSIRNRFVLEPYDRRGFD